VVTASGVGSWPGEDASAYAEAVRVALGELSLPYLPELPGRGPVAGPAGRGVAVLAELAADLQPAGWRLTGAGSPGVDQRRARSLLAQDLDQVEEVGQGLTGVFKVQVAGPWTLAATVERPRGDRLLADHGARRELAESLAEGVAAHVRDVRRRLPGVERLVVQLDEPSLPEVLAGRVPTASGYGRHRAVGRSEVSESLRRVLEAVTAERAEPWVHGCARDMPLDLVRGAGARGLAVDLARVDAGGLEALAGALDAGETVAVGVLPITAPATPPTAGEVAEGVLRWLDVVGLDPVDVGSRLVVTPACGLAGAGPAWARRALGLAEAAARELPS
jgi:methionine synthase II (cobalamin-independent)